jgi:zinc protease
VSETRLTELYGIPVLLAPTAGPMRAGLMFRVGRADETLAFGGLTHLVEHLALHRHGTADYHYNGITSATTTQFVTQGNSEAVVTFLNDVCSNLRYLPFGRLATEKKILETEAANKSTGVNDQMPLWRHGARDYGLLSYPEWGMRTLTEEQVRQWALTRFNRANAVLWIAGDRVPNGLHLDLPDGDRWPLPHESSALPVTPAYFSTGSQVIVMDAQIPRTRAAVMHTRLLERALFRELRQNRGLSYTAAAAYTTDGRHRATLTAIVDALPDKLDDALECFLGELGKLEVQEIDPAEFEAVRTLELEAFDNPEVEANLLTRRATDLLTGFPSSTTAELVDGFHNVRAEDIPEIAHAAEASALLMVPHHLSHRVVGFEAAPTCSRFGIAGVRYRSRSERGLSLVHGADGVSLTRPQGSATVLFDECAAVMRWQDGARHLFGSDGINVRIEPTLFKIPATKIAEIDRAVSPDVIIDMPPRDPANIPKASRAKGLRGRLRNLLLPWRARLDHAAVTRGGIRAMVIAAVLLMTTIVAAVLAIVTGTPRFFSIAVIVGAILVWRRRNLRHW